MTVTETHSRSGMKPVREPVDRPSVDSQVRSLSLPPKSPRWAVKRLSRLAAARVGVSALYDDLRDTPQELHFAKVTSKRWRWGHRLRRDHQHEPAVETSLSIDEHLALRRCRVGRWTSRR